MKSKNRIYYKYFLFGITVVALALSNFILNGSAQKFTNTLNLNSSSLIEEDFSFSYSFSVFFIHPPVYVGGEIHVEYTVLAVTHGNVSFDGTQRDSHTWSPVPENFTLQLGEQYSENFTLLHGLESRGIVSYVAYLTEENTNATVRFGYEIINSGTKPAPLPVGIILFSFIFISTCNLMKRGKKQ